MLIRASKARSILSVHVMDIRMSGRTNPQSYVVEIVEIGWSRRTDIIFLTKYFWYVFLVNVNYESLIEECKKMFEGRISLFLLEQLQSYLVVWNLTRKGSLAFLTWRRDVWEGIANWQTKRLSNCTESLLHVLLTINFWKKEELETVGELSKASYLWDKILQVTLKRSGEYEILSSVNLGRRKYELRMWFWSANFGNRELGMVQMTLEICLSETHASGKPRCTNKRSFISSNVDSRCKGDNGKGMRRGHKEGAHKKQKVRKVPLCCIDRHPPHLKVQEHTRECSQEQSISSLDISTSTSRWMFARAMSSVEIMKF